MAKKKGKKKSPPTAVQPSSNKCPVCKSKYSKQNKKEKKCIKCDRDLHVAQEKKEEKEQETVLQIQLCYEQRDLRCKMFHMRKDQCVRRLNNLKKKLREKRGTSPDDILVSKIEFCELVLFLYDLPEDLLKLVMSFTA